MHPSILSLQQTLERVASEFLPVSSETVRFDRAFGRILVGPLVADRDSPAIHVSAMDGFAMRLRDISSSRLPIAGTIQAGEPPLPLPLDATIKILTGAAVPDGAELVIRREDVEEHEDWIRVKDEIRSPQMGENIRYRGENIRQGARVLEDGTCLGPSQIAAITTFGAEYVSVRRKVRLAIINTGDELKQPGESVEPWQIRDSNGPVLESIFHRIDYLELVSRVRVRDSLESFVSVIAEALAAADAVILTGGVSMGETDQVPDAIVKLGGRVIVHKIPIRPGKPMLMARGPQGQMILGLPGNPVSTAVTAKRFAMPLLRKLAGFPTIEANVPWVTIRNPDSKTLPLVWYRLAKEVGPSEIELLEPRGSGDVVALAQSHGVVEIPTGQQGPGPWPWYPW